LYLTINKESARYRIELNDYQTKFINQIIRSYDVSNNYYKCLTKHIHHNLWYIIICISAEYLTDICQKQIAAPATLYEIIKNLGSKINVHPSYVVNDIPESANTIVDPSQIPGIPKLNPNLKPFAR